MSDLEAPHGRPVLLGVVRGEMKAPDWFHDPVTGRRSDHEAYSSDEGRERLRAGMWLLIREGSAARNLHALLPPDAVKLRIYSVQWRMGQTAALMGPFRKPWAFGYLMVDPAQINR